MSQAVIDIRCDSCGEQVKGFFEYENVEELPRLIKAWIELHNKGHEN